MFINYISLMLINLASGLALLAGYLSFGLGSLNQKHWIPYFSVVGAIANNVTNKEFNHAEYHA
jgi:putative membrane protein